MSTGIKVFLTVFTGWAVYLMGGWDKLLEIVLVMICIDYATGVLRAIIQKKVNSKIGFVGIARKVLIFVMIVLAVQIEKAVGQPELIHPVVTLFYISNEGISILENIGAAGLPLPRFLKDLLLALNKSTDEGKRA